MKHPLARPALAAVVTPAAAIAARVAAAAGRVLCALGLHEPRIVAGWLTSLRWPGREENVVALTCGRARCSFTERIPEAYTKALRPGRATSSSGKLPEAWSPVP